MPSPDQREKQAELLEALRTTWLTDLPTLALFNEAMKVVESGGELTEEQESLVVAVFSEPGIPVDIVARTRDLSYPLIYDLNAPWWAGR